MPRGFFSRGHVWPAFTIALILAAISFYLFLIASNWFYLGWSDTLYFFSHPRMWQRFWLTVWTSTVSMALSLLIGIPAGYALSRFSFPCRNLFASIVDLPIVVSPAVIGAFLFGITTRFPFDLIGEHYHLYIGRNIYGVLLVQFTVTCAFCARLMKASFDMIPERFETVSRSLGASHFRTFFKLVLPMARNGIVASAIVVWARAAAEWEGLMLFVGATEGQTDILPFAVYLDWNGGMMGWVSSMTLVCVLMAVAAMAAMRLIGGKSRVW
ncbi:MAG: ABC transporter permease [Deltaproteobacteria bacterium]|nr:ABC transporter permease [Deltaproteobacteria bacterium]